MLFNKFLKERDKLSTYRKRKQVTYSNPDQIAIACSYPNVLFWLNSCWDGHRWDGAQSATREDLFGKRTSIKKTSQNGNLGLNRGPTFCHNRHTKCTVDETLHFRTLVLKMEPTCAEEPAGYGKFSNASNGRKFVEVGSSKISDLC